MNINLTRHIMGTDKTTAFFTIRSFHFISQYTIMAASVQDGAFAWLLCVACFFNIILIGGIVQTSGIFYIMFRESLDATDQEVSIITSINIGVLHFVCK